LKSITLIAAARAKIFVSTVFPGRVMRKVKSIYARRQISPVKKRTPMKNPFTSLTGIVDSEASDEG